MHTLASSPAERQPARRPVAPYRTPADQLDALADRLARLGHGARDAEAFVVEKWTLVRLLQRLAREARA